jgi:hypothetical protein
MKYLCLIYESEKNWARYSKAEADQIKGEYFAYTTSIQSSGHYQSGNPLQPTSAATTVRIRNGKLSTTDGPFAKDLNEAIQVGSRIPAARTGSIEVRPIVEFPSA